MVMFENFSLLVDFRVSYDLKYEIKIDGYQKEDEKPMSQLHC